MTVCRSVPQMKMIQVMPHLPVAKLMRKKRITVRSHMIPERPLFKTLRRGFHYYS